MIGFARDEGLPGTGGSPTMSARFQTTRGLAYLHYDRAMISAPAAACPRACSRPGSAIG